MRDIILLSILGLVLLAPAHAGAAEICQNKKTGHISTRNRCDGKYRRVQMLNEMSRQVGEFDGRIATLERLGMEGTTALAGIQIQLADGFAALTLLNARFPVAAADVRANAINGDKVQDGSLGLAELGVPLIRPHPGAASGAHWRIATAELDLSVTGVDGDDIGVEAEEDDWLALSLRDAPEATVELTLEEGVFAGQPRCLGSLSESGSPDAAQNLEVKMLAADRIRVRVVGTDRQLNVHGTLLCAGVAGEL